MCALALIGNKSVHLVMQMDSETITDSKSGSNSEWTIETTAVDLAQPGNSRQP